MTNQSTDRFPTDAPAVVASSLLVMDPVQFVAMVSEPLLEIAAVTLLDHW
ncbi:hypothetical protein [Halosolutus halophilus]|nr:hypothetical protein [Halosolutus halophilus]